MKKAIEVILCIFGVAIALIALFWFSIVYVTDYKKTTCDKSISSDKKFELTLQAIGEPDWPFGSASGRLLLEEGENKVSQTDFELRNDGGIISSRCWKVTWYEDYVEVVLSGEEQEDESIYLYFDGRREYQ
ncbi:MAG: hypothetical protein HFI37_00320 [Lachnospiraceae bacterium]|nr:hypothetical protein [Lachnospiraceae bacterium]